MGQVQGCETCEPEPCRTGGGAVVCAPQYAASDDWDDLSCLERFDKVAHPTLPTDYADGLFVFELQEGPDQPPRRIRYDVDESVAVPSVLASSGEAWSVVSPGGKEHFFLTLTRRPTSRGRLALYQLQREVGRQHLLCPRELFEGQDGLYVCFPFVAPSSLADLVHYQRSLTVEETLVVMRGVFEALVELHSRRLALNSFLNPEVVLFGTDANGEAQLEMVQLAPVGCFLPHQSLAFHAREDVTSKFVAPEALRCAQDLGPPADVWSAGSLLFWLLTGCMPRTAQVSSAWTKPDARARDLLTQLLHMDPSKRPTAQDALQHAWFTEPHTEIKPEVAPERKVLTSEVEAEAGA